MKRALLLCVLSLALMAPLAHSEVIAHVTIPVTGAIVYGCVEPILLSGQLNVLVRTTTDAAGGIHFGIHQNAQGVSGIGLYFATPYRSTLAQNTVVIVPGPPPVEMTDVLHLNLIGRGQGSDLHLRSRTHVTINANGEVTADLLDFQLTCP